MTWALLAIVVMARGLVPTWPATIAAGVLTGLATATRFGGILSQAYLVAAMALVALEVGLRRERAATHAIPTIALRTLAALAVGWITMVALWPWLQAPDPLHRFRIAASHFSKLSLSF